MSQETKIPVDKPVRQQGRPNAISDESYYRDIEEQLNAGTAIDEITPTALFKRVGGSYKRAVDLLDKFKAGYEVKAVQTQPEVPENIQREGIRMLNDLLHRITAMSDESHLKTIDSMKDAHKEELATRDTTNKQQQDLIEELSQEREELQEVVSGFSGKLNDAIDQNHKHEESIAILQEEVRKANQELVQKRETVKQQDFRIDDLMKEVADRDAVLNKTRIKLEEAQDENSDAIDNLHECRKNRELALQQLEQANNQFDQLDQNFRLLETAKQAKDKLHQELLIKTTKLESDNENLSARMGDMQEARAVLSGQVADYKSILQEKDEQLEKLREELQQAHIELEKAKAVKKSGK